VSEEDTWKVPETIMLLVSKELMIVESVPGRSSRTIPESVDEISVESLASKLIVGNETLSVDEICVVSAAVKTTGPNETVSEDEISVLSIEVITTSRLLVSVEDISVLSVPDFGRVPVA
jgi:hypothetical protein